MPHLYVQVSIPHVSGLSRDTVNNSFNFNAPDPADVGPAIDEFYNTPVLSTGDSVASLIADCMSRTEPITVKAWTAVPGDLGEPLFEGVLSELAAAGNAAVLPSEVALCLSFKNTTNTALVAPRRRGRVYIGPLHAGVVDSGTGNAVGRPTEDAMRTLVDAGERLGGNVDAGWEIWSRAGNAFSTVQQVWVDNEFDTQRRRGNRATFRYVENIFTPGP